MTQEPFTQELWTTITSIYKAIKTHPFIQGLVDGSLEEEKFRFYIIQDSLYLSEYARALSIAAAKAPNDEWTIAFNEHARISLMAEKALHQSLFKDWGLSGRDVFSTPMSPTNLAYTKYLNATACSKPFHELLGALLPCYWIYWEIGKELEKRSSKKEIFRRWIDTYSSREYADICKTVLNITNTIAKNLTENQKEDIKTHFITVSKYEYMFWDSAYKLEKWQI